MKNFLAFLTSCLFLFCIISVANATSMVNGLGGTAGFGENTFVRNDDGSLYVDVASVFDSGGLNFFGTSYTAFYLNNNGNITFNSALSTYTPFNMTGATGIPIIAPFFADVDTNGGIATATPGGTSTGSNLVYFDLDTVNGIFTATWDDVGYYEENIDPLNAFQLQLIDRSDVTNGDFDILFTYEDINWTVGEASGTSYARAGWNNGDGTNYYELPQSGNNSAMLGLETTPGSIRFEVRNGNVTPTPAVPEPTTCVLFLVGMLGIVGIKKKLS